jgi:hypothetical protein
MPALATPTLVIIFIVCLFGALFTWFAADQYRNQLLGDSHRLVRDMALRYLQGMIISTTVLVIGLVVSLILLVTSLFRADEAGTAATPVETAVTPAATRDPFGAPATLPPLPTDLPDLPTATLLAPASDPTLAAAQSARIGGTNGLGVNLRDAPGLESNVVGIIPEGSPVTLTGETEFVDGLNWVAVIGPNGERGWVTDLFLVFEE